MNIKRRFISLFFLLAVLLGMAAPQKIRAIDYVNMKAYLYQDRRSGITCYYPDCIDIQHRTFIKVTAYANQDINRAYTRYDEGEPIQGNVTIRVNGTKIATEELNQGELIIDIGSLNEGSNEIRIILRVPGRGSLGTETAVKESTVVVKTTCSKEELEHCGEEHVIDESIWYLCKQVDEKNMDECQGCFNNGGIWTALGCIPTDPTGLIQTLIKIGLMVGGGIATLIILAGGFMLSISQGDPKKTSEAKEMISAAVIGLIFIVFSISILQLIGVQILQIPGFGE